jgi:hypothetical protein
MKNGWANGVARWQKKSLSFPTSVASIILKLKTNSRQEGYDEGSQGFSRDNPAPYPHGGGDCRACHLVAGGFLLSLDWLSLERRPGG